MALDSPSAASRLTLTIQGYDQVVALSQSNINDTLERHFAQKDYREFNVEDPTDYKGIEGEILPPTIELIDVENADQALYCIEFDSGTFTYYKARPRPPGSKGRPDFDTVKVNVKGWKLAFYVDFSFKAMGQIPEKFRDIYLKPGSYSVQQLMIEFGTAENVKFSSDQSELVGVKPEDRPSIMASLKVLVGVWIETAKERDDHNILAYALKVNDPGSQDARQKFLNEIAPSNPSFPPTAVRLQTVNHWPGGDSSKASTKNGLNAFLFTEMTGFRDMVRKDLQRSGDFFYRGIGGTMMMARHLFWNDWLVPKLQTVNRKYMVGIDQALRYMTRVDERRIGCMIARPQDMNGVGYWSHISDTEATFEHQNHIWGEHPFLFDWGEWNNLHETQYYHWCPGLDFRIKVRLFWVPGSNTVVYDAEVSYKTVLEWKIRRSQDWWWRATTNVQRTFRCNIRLTSVPSSGALGITVDTVESLPSVTEVVASQFSDNLPEGWTKYSSEATLKDMTEKVSAIGACQGHVEAELRTAVNDVQPLVLPGAGVFDMKDPLFANNGDLMVGLTYRTTT